MSDEKFPKPWTLERTDQRLSFAVCDADGRKLFYITEDDPEDDEHTTPGDPEGPTVLGNSEEETEELIDAIEDAFKGAE